MLLLACSCGHAQPSYNLDFEQLNEDRLPKGWGMGNITGRPTLPDTAHYRLDATHKQHGAYSLLIDWSKGSSDWTSVAYVIPKTFRGSKIKLSGYLRTENVTDGYAGLWMRIDSKWRETLAFDNMQDRGVKGTTDWKQYSVELDYDPSKARTITFGGLLVGKGKMWLDNLSITIDDVDIAKAQPYAPQLTKPELDSTFNHSSGVAVISTDAAMVSRLSSLGMLWGFIKYYHPAVGKGEYNMDAELFRILPKVLAAKDNSEAFRIMEEWTDHFGKPEPCKKCKAIVKEDDTWLMPEYSGLFDRDVFPASLITRLEYIKANRYSEGSHYYVTSTQYVGNPEFTHEYPYPDLPYPDAGIRLLALYRYWNMIQYFYPDRHLMDENWGMVLTEFVPRFCQAADSDAYALACQELIGRIHDTHGNVWGNQLSNVKGQLISPVSARFVENKLMVTGYYTEDAAVKDKLKPGDVIESIDGVGMDELIKKHLPHTPASNYETQLRDLPRVSGYLLRSNKKEMQLGIDRDGQKLQVNTERIPITEKMSLLDRKPPVDKGYKVMDGNIGYIYPALLAEKDLEKIKELMNNTKGIVIDMRCYPSVFMTFSYAEWLKPSASPFVKFTFMDPAMPGMFRVNKGPENGRNNPQCYKGKLVILVNAETQSSAEYQTIALCTVPGCKVIGSTTAGADGNVTSIVLPGGINTVFSGIGILYPDGTESQRKGVKIDKVVKPSIRGVKAGRDEVLEEALKLINS